MATSVFVFFALYSYTAVWFPELNALLGYVVNVSWHAVRPLAAEYCALYGRNTHASKPRHKPLADAGADNAFWWLMRYAIYTPV